MLEKIARQEKLPKKIYKKRLRALQKRLFRLQRAYWELGLASVVVVEGWDGSGKGDVVNRLTERLEPRAFKLHYIRAPRTHETMMPSLWRFWMKLPSYREMGIFVPSWYAGFIEGRVAGALDDQEWQRVWRRVSDFERALADDRYVVVKLFLHLDKKTRARRLEKLKEEPATAWKVDERVREAHERYGEYRPVIEDVLVRTESEWGPWTIVEASDPRGTRVRSAEAVVDRLAAGLLRRGLGDALEARAALGEDAADDPDNDPDSDPEDDMNGGDDDDIENGEDA